MGKVKVYITTLQLADIEHFFRKPEISPFSPDYHEYSYTAGIEYLANELYANPSSQEVRVTLLLPSEKMVSGLEQQTQEAVQRYCSGRVKEIEQEGRGLLHRALQGFLPTLIALIGFITLGTELSTNTSLLVRTVGDVLIVIGWVFVWFPLDSLVFGVWHYDLNGKIYQKLMTMQLTLMSAD
jgi:hypothetical protein